MNSFYKILNLIILSILILTFILYIITTKQNKDAINEVKEAFQVNNDYKSIFFDLSSNFYKLREDEKPPGKPPPLDEVILDIGGAFGGFDASRIPWDTENRGYKPGEVLWGVVSQQASVSLFNKINDIKQTSDITSLPFDQDKKKFTYESPLFMTSATTEEEKQALVAAEQVVNLAYPVLFEIIAGGEVKNTLKALRGGIVSAAKGLYRASGVVAGAAVKGLRLIGVLSKTVDKAALKVADKLVGEAGEAVLEGAAKSSKTALNAGVKIASESEAVAAFLARKIGTEVAEEIGEKASAKAGAEVAKVVGKGMMKTVGKVISGFLVSFVSLGAIPVIGPNLDIIYMVIVMPLMMGLMMSGVIDGALSKVADQEGCCPAGSVAMNELIPEAGMMIISNIPIIGDILSLFYPYLCSASSGALVYKNTLTQPKWMGYSWLSCFYIQWPEYNCRIGGKAPVFGKMLLNSPPRYDWNNALGSDGTFTMLSLMAANQRNYCQTIRKFNAGKIDDSEKQCVLPSPNMKFFYADFSEPLMLIEMGKFYYRWAMKNPRINDDGTITIEYISKINYVSASSMYSCDAMCEMTNITFNPITGEDYTETVTYDRDRRFYYTCDNSVSAPPHWEDQASRLTQWRALDDAYDLAIHDLNTFIHGFPTNKLDAGVLRTAYTQIMDASNRYTFISNVTKNNVSNDYFDTTNTTVSISNLHNMVRNDPNVRTFYKDYTDAETTFDDIMRDNIGRNNAIPGGVRSRCTNIYNISEQIFQFRYNSTDSDSHYTKNTLKNYQYTLIGCTNADYTASAAATPYVRSLEEDSRYRCNFNVVPFLVRCKGVNMSISKCIDASNIEQVIYNYLLQNPNKRIKNINSIKAKGVNACEFRWDEVTINTTTRVGTNSNKDVVTEVLYQQDLSSCTFFLPPPVGISGTSNYLFGTQNGTISPIILPPESIKMFRKPVDLSNLANYSNYTTLRYKPATFNFPAFTPPNPIPTSFLESNVDYIPRYDPKTFRRIPDLIRPRKPIRIFYPGEEESKLGNYTSNYCSDPVMLEKFLLTYNGNSNNVDKIVQVVRAFTSSSNMCDIEVDKIKMATNKLTRTTMTINMIEGFQASPQSNTRQFIYQSINSSNYGLNIDRNTDSLSNPYQDGVGFGKPYLRSFQTDVVPYTSFFNDDLIKDFTGKTKSLRDYTNRLLVGLTGTRHLGAPPCTTKCQEPIIVQRIIEQYNKDNTASTRLDAEENSVVQVLNSATNSSNTCHVLLQNRQELYGDFYSPNKKSPTNYYTESRLKFKKVLMEDEGNCSFYPVPNQIYQDISASDLALSSSANFNTYVTPKRIDCPPVNCGDSNLYNSAFSDYENKTGNTLSNAEKYIAIGKNRCDYLIKTTIELSDGTPLTVSEEEEEEESGGESLFDLVLRVNYDAPLYRADSTANCATDFNYTYSYNPDNFVLQVPLDLSDVVANPEYYQLVDSNSTFGSPLIGELDDNAVIRSAIHNIA